MHRLRYGGIHGRAESFTVSEDLIAIRTDGYAFVEPALKTMAARRALSDFYSLAQFPDAGVEVLRAKVRRGAKARRDSLRTYLARERQLRFSGKVLQDPRTKRPVVYTENLFVKFDSALSGARCRAILKEFGLVNKREVTYSRNAYLVAAPSGTGLAVFSMAEKMLQRKEVELCHPETVRESRNRSLFPQQWNLAPTVINGVSVDAHVDVQSAWDLCNRGTGAVIAVIDDGVDIDHEEFAGAWKVVAPHDALFRSSDPRPRFFGENHGTPCAGIACANGSTGASGVAPSARLMPIRKPVGTGSQAEADAFVWAADHGADVISCSWGPEDGDWADPDDPRHQNITPLPDATRLAIEHAVNTGRNGAGCVIVWAAGNGNEPVDNDGYASNDKVIAVAACNAQGRRSRYSDYGAAVWCSFPSDDFADETGIASPGIWTTDRTGREGLNPARTRADVAGHYTDAFGGTSAACPGVAGVAALVLAANPTLQWHQVKDLLRFTSDRIDETAGEYDPETGHSRFYGYGRINAARAVAMALELA